MKNILIVKVFLFVFLSITSQLTAQELLGVTGGSTYQLSDPRDPWPTVMTRHAKGGWHTCPDTFARNAITPARRDTGMVAFCLSDSTIWQLRGGVANENWHMLSGNSTGIPDSARVSGTTWGIRGQLIPALAPGFLNWNPAGLGFSWINRIDSATLALSSDNSDKLDNQHGQYYLDHDTAGHGALVSGFAPALVGTDNYLLKKNGTVTTNSIFSDNGTVSTSYHGPSSATPGTILAHTWRRNTVYGVAYSNILGLYLGSYASSAGASYSLAQFGLCNGTGEAIDKIALSISGTGYIGIGGEGRTFLDVQSTAPSPAVIDTSLISRWTRPGIYGVSWGNGFDILMGNYESGGAKAHTRIDFKLQDGTSALPDANVLSLFGNGNIKISGNCLSLSSNTGIATAVKDTADTGAFNVIRGRSLSAPAAYFTTAWLTNLIAYGGILANVITANDLKTKKIALNSATYSYYGHPWDTCQSSECFILDTIDMTVDTASIFFINLENKQAGTTFAIRITGGIPGQYIKIYNNSLYGSVYLQVQTVNGTDIKHQISPGYYTDFYKITNDNLSWIVMKADNN
jgi:hypothetical protein